MTLASVVSSDGTTPTSVAELDGLVYAMDLCSGPLQGVPGRSLALAGHWTAGVYAHPGPSA